jgi:hypothetical protein
MQEQTPTQVENFIVGRDFGFFNAMERNVASPTYRRTAMSSFEMWPVPPDPQHAVG